MKKLLIILLSSFSLATFAQPKKMAVMEPICRDNSVELFHKNVIRGAVESVVSSTDEYDVFDRTAFDQIVKEHNFQRSGAVSDSQIKRIGEMAGVDYVLVSELAASSGYMSVIVKVLNVITGKYEGAKDGILSMDNIPEVRNKTVQLVSGLFGIVDMSTGKRKGELQLAEGKYVGEIQNGKPHGKGIITYNASDHRKSYEGDWVNGVRTGQGTMIWNTGEKYVGGWRNGLRSGYGVDYYANGDRYEGNFENDKRNGKGKFYYSASDEYSRKSYEGDWVNGERTGQGTMIWNDGEKYVGGWKNSSRYGYGVDYYANGARYEGNFENGKRNGQGTYYYKDGTRFEGIYKDDKSNGKGTYYFSKGRNVGTWVNGKENGPATIYWKDGDKDSGNYVNGEKDGDWVRITSDGKRRKAKYSNGELVRDWHI